MVINLNVGDVNNLRQRIGGEVGGVWNKCKNVLKMGGG